MDTKIVSKGPFHSKLPTLEGQWASSSLKSPNLSLLLISHLYKPQARKPTLLLRVATLLVYVHNPLSTLMAPGLLLSVERPWGVLTTSLLSGVLTQLLRGDWPVIASKEIQSSNAQCHSYLASISVKCEDRQKSCPCFLLMISLFNCQWLPI